MKKIIPLVFSLVLIASLTVGCTGPSESQLRNKMLLHANTGYTYFTENKYDLARGQFEEALKSSKKNGAEYYRYLAETSLLDGKFKNGLYNLEKSYELDPYNIVTNNSLGLFFIGAYGEDDVYTDYNKSLKYLKYAYEHSDAELVKENYALANYLAEEYDLALDLFLDANLENKPYNNYYVGTIYVIKREHELGRRHLERALEMGLDNETEKLARMFVGVTYEEPLSEELMNMEFDEESEAYFDEIFESALEQL